MAKTGRNEPCPCGSGKKFKKCCLINGGAALVAKELEGIEDQLKKRAEAGANARERKPGRAPVNFTQRRDEFDRMLEATEELDEETAFYAADELVLSAATCDERGMVNECLESFRERHPRLYSANTVLYAKWMITNDLLCGRADRIARYFIEAAESANRDINSFHMIISCLAYYGELKTLLEGMRIAWPKVRADGDIMGWAEEEFAVNLCYYEIFAHLENVEGSHVPEDELMAHLHDFLDFDAKYAKKYLLQFGGRSEEPWGNEDPFVLQKDPDRLTVLTNAFLYHVRSTRGISYTKAKMAGDALRKYFLNRHAGSTEP